MAEFRPRIWDTDATGQKKPNKWMTMNRLPEVNRLTMARFEKLCRDYGLRVEKRVIGGFGGSFLARMTRAFLHVPYLREGFTSCAVYTLRKGEATA
jgi:hypothetical protein